MNRIAIVIAAGLAFLATLSAAPVQAQNGRSFVSSHGLDSNPCTLAAPCRTFAVAITHTNAGGEIDVLDTAGYGPLTIDKAISIVNDGAIASVLVPSGGTGITINAGSSDAVSLRGLTIEGAGVGLEGIHFMKGRSLTVESSTIRDFSGNGIDFVSPSGKLVLSNTLVADNGSLGILVQPSGSFGVNAILSRVQANNNGSAGILIEGQSSTGTLNVTIADSIAANNFGGGIYCKTDAAHAPTAVMVLRSVAASNGDSISGAGVSADGAGAKILIGQSALTSNTSGWIATNSGIVQSYGDNKIDLNGTLESAPPSVANK